MHYEERPPPSELEDVVRCTWFLRGGVAGEVQRVVPDGCPEIIVNRADPFACHDEGGTSVQPTTPLVGQIRSALLISPTGEVDLVGIRFRPEGLAAFLDDAVAQVTDQQVAVTDAFAALDAALRDAMVGSGGIEVTTRRVHTELMHHRRRRVSPLVRAAVDRIEAAAGHVRVEAVARDLDTTRRSLERRFRDDVGFGPKRFARIARFQSSVQALEAEPRRDRARLALALGFSDQAHFNREFRAHAGQTPSRWLAEDHRFSDCFTGSAH
ncbi:MAG: hypothetical protein CMJ83_16295 [Planctomycetes bacterium]|jgi:AraC-like DNA-binding protein|nr:hypothetical protein [Planctomycetota bacterium]